MVTKQKNSISDSASLFRKGEPEAGLFLQRGEKRGQEEKMRSQKALKKFRAKDYK